MRYSEEDQSPQPWNILLVDDDEDDYLLVKEMLRQSDVRPIQISWAASFDDGIGAVQSGNYDAVLVDYDLGNKDGIEFIRQQKATGNDIPLILYTGRGGYQVDLEAQQAGATSYLAKTEASPLLLERAIRYSIERHRVEQALQKIRAHLAEAQKVAKMGSWELNLDDNIGIWSDEMYHLLGMEPSPLPPVFDDFVKTVHPEDREGFLQNHAEAIQTGSTVTFEYRGLKQSGEIIHLESNAEGIRNSDGRVIKLIGTLQDITDRKRMEQASEKIHLQSKLIDSLSDAVVTVDNDFIIQSWNKGAESLYGWSSSEAIGRPFRNVVPTQYPDPPREAFIEQLYRTGRSTGVVIQKRKDGSTIYVQSAVTRLFDAQGNPVGAAAVNRDHTGQKEAEAERLSLLRESQHRLEVAEALHSVDVAINASIDLNTTLNVVLSNIISRLKADAADVFLFNKASRSFEFAAVRGFRTAVPPGIRLDLLNSYAGQAVLERRTIQVARLDNLSGESGFARLCETEEFKSYTGVPLISKGQVNGVLEVFHRKPFSPDSEWLNFLEMLAGQAAISIDNAQLYEVAQRANNDLALAVDAIIDGWARAMDKKEGIGEGHSQRLASLTVDIATRMGVSAYELPHIRHGALLHDIGKAAVPDRVLLKPARLSAEEWAIMQTHPQAAYDLLSGIRFLQRALDIPLYHHEKWDGTGYPRGLRKEEIPLAARIFAVVDVWDALTSNRPYRGTAWPADKALEYIRSQSGRQFDPQVVEVFMEVVGVS